ncbi:MAG: hypothetical protein BAJATHORv1_30302 [Candidatus Thorarchaeota archaeon]|nr:MAG: hypothetical protein BAJATHORv1_30302 [Candidatus Thorarchaeota archaeon]
MNFLILRKLFFVYKRIDALALVIVSWSNDIEIITSFIYPYCISK